MNIVNKTSLRDFVSVHRLSCPKVHPYLLCLMYSERSLLISLLHNSCKIRTLYGSGSKTILSRSSPMHLESFCLVSAPKTLAVKPTRLCECNYIGCSVPFSAICIAYYVCTLYLVFIPVYLCRVAALGQQPALDRPKLQMIYSNFIAAYLRRNDTEGAYSFCSNIRKLNKLHPP